MNMDTITIIGRVLCVLIILRNLYLSVDRRITHKEIEVHWWQAFSGWLLALIFYIAIISIEVTK